jgi:hypothetical protein
LPAFSPIRNKAPQEHIGLHPERCLTAETPREPELAYGFVALASPGE